MSISQVFTLIAVILFIIGAAWTIWSYNDHRRGRPTSRRHHY